ncbi:hypothetical protein [Ramlibacter sp.]|uniref:portal protein n=1 Tax=Ramlibacter sp. TaxID=1917967 RepID=UPI003D1352CD
MNYQLTPGGVLAPMTPLAPYDDRPGDDARDFAEAGRYSLYALERMLRDCTEQPDWRLRAKLAASYYDGKQMDEVRRWLLREEDLDERVVNLIRPIVNSVLGQEAKSRTDVRLEADDDNYQDVVEYVSGRLKEAERETFAHQSVSNAYGSMVKKGLGWLHVCRNSDPMAYPYRFEDVDIDEIWFDWKGMGKKVRMDDRCRWLARMRMVDLDELEAAFPQFKELLRRTARGWDDFRMDTNGMLGEPEDLQITSAYENERRFNTMYRKWDWIDSARRMIKLIEVWYRVPAMAVCLQLTPTRRVQYNPQDQRHVEAVARGLVKVVKGPTSQVRRALYAGPHRLLDEATTRKSFPYVPMFAYRDDDDGSPYGLVDGMIAPQDDYNDRRHRIQWMLKARQLWIDNDAVDTDFNSIEDIAEQVNRPDLVAVLKASRANGAAAVRVENTLSLQKEQFELLGISEMDVQKAAGRYSSNLGEAKVQSGIANSLLIEQGEQAMGDMNDNYVYARRAAFEQLVDLIVEDHKGENLKVQIGQGKARRTIVLNSWQQPVAVDEATGQPVPVPDAAPTPVNMVADASIVTALGEVPNTPAYRSQLQTQLKDIITALSGNAPALNIVTPAYIESTNLANRQQVADDFRRATGQPLTGDRKAREAAEAQQQKALQTAQALEARKAKGEAEDKEASAALRRAQARKTALEAVELHRRLNAGAVEEEVDGMAAANEGTRAANAAANDPVQGALDDALSAVG